MSGFLETLALRGAGLVPAAGPAPVMPRPRARFEPGAGLAMDAGERSGFAEVDDEVPAARTPEPEAPAAPPRDALIKPDPAPSETQPAMPMTRPADDMTRAQVAEPAVRPEPGRPTATSRPDRTGDGPAQSLGPAPSPAPTPRVLPAGEPNRSEPPARLIAPGTPTPNTLASEREGARPTPAVFAKENDASLRPSVSPVPVSEPPSERVSKGEPPPAETEAPVAIVARPSEPDPARPAATKPAGERAAPEVTVTIGRIEVTTTPPQPPATRAQPQRTRGFQGYERVRRGRAR